MILVHLTKSWPDFLAGTRTAEDVTLGDWALVSDDAIRAYGDTICGVYQAEIVSAFDIEGHVRNEGGRVRFHGRPSHEWGHMVGQPSPVTWVRGQARPVRYLDTDAMRRGSVEPEVLADDLWRAIVGEYVLTVDADGAATLALPPGGSVTVTARTDAVEQRR